ncbi:carbamoyltransferase HypF [Roseibium aggregatum]|uniref:Carbamoyltransferase HypF n=1 Tax=Roseibium aggregatum TaxID=187304 RepID=A0A939EFL0_9HYPH|nr:carbamoyltransferase HypF [Roseibium aggregatum]MBN9672332.1 carbamoyltransferase HypF [Roseibium aggregatum]
MAGTRVRIKGLVQGVGFRPFVWRLALEEGVKGRVLNDAEGVLVLTWGRDEAIRRFLERLEAEAPPLARIDRVSIEPATDLPEPHTDAFRIVESAPGPAATGIVPDAATCPQCLKEVFDPASRRYGYAFTNCTHCGPRFSIVRAIPYDRENTAMACFRMCEQCQAEYDAPENRRFHAQPNACPQCGPGVWYEENGRAIGEGDPIEQAALRLRQGEVVAVKGLGGFHLAASAWLPEAVRRLRARKRRPDKPLALMARDLEQARTFCEFGALEASLLESSAAPVVLLKQLADPGLAGEIAPGQDRYGVMLPYTPLHHLLMAQLPGPIVLTSGNLSEEPQAIDNMDARNRLGGIADGFLMHDRAIVNRLDDSVAGIRIGKPAVFRRARGYAPAPFRLHGAFTAAPRILAMGGDLKAAFCLLRDGEAVMSQHMGDLENRRALRDFEDNLSLYREIHDFEPERIAVDCHPDYLSARLGRNLAEETGIGLVEVQHHHAHLGACLAEARVEPGADETLAIVLDGSGYGRDGTVWGGELLTGGYRGFERTGHFLPVALPGGGAAVREPWRNLTAHLIAAFGPGYRSKLAGTGLEELLSEKNLPVMERMIEKRLNSPLSSSAGRLFDAVAAALGVCFDRQSYEGQTGAALEALAGPYLERESGYPVAVSSGRPVVLSWAPFWEALLSDLKKGVCAGRISARAHLGLLDSLSSVSAQLAGEREVNRIVLSGGAMQNRILAEGLHRRLIACGFSVLVPREFPVNDGGLSLGQAAVAGMLSCQDGDP